VASDAAGVVAAIVLIIIVPVILMWVPVRTDVDVIITSIVNLA